MFNTELISWQTHWRTVDYDDLATLGSLDWFNNRCLHTALGDVPDADYEEAECANPASTDWETQPPSPHQTQWDSVAKVLSTSAPLRRVFTIPEDHPRGTNLSAPKAFDRAQTGLAQTQRTVKLPGFSATTRNCLPKNLHAARIFK